MMRMSRFPLGFLALGLLSLGSIAMDSPSFRGAERDGIYSEKGLMKSWPAEGPKELWAFEGLGEGYASVAVHNGTIYTVGKNDLEGFLYAIDDKGQLKWQVKYGAETDGRGFPGSRSTPSIDGSMLYITTGPGKVMAFNTSDGKKAWEADMVAQFNGKPPRFSYSESVLIDGNNVICMPGGPDVVLAALDKKTGKLVWQTSAKEGESASYCSARTHKVNGKRQIITLTSGSMLAVDPADGKRLWDFTYPVKYGIHANSPVFHDNLIYVSDGYKQGGKGFELTADGVKEIWSEPSLDIHHGGIVAWDGFAYGASSSGVWGAIDMKTGEVKSTTRDLGKGSVILADGLLYGYDEKGNVGLINPDPNKIEVISTFNVSKGDGQHWGHPVISDGRLFIRHGNALMCYDIKG